MYDIDDENAVIMLSVINVQPGLRYRFRIINTSCHPYFNSSMDGRQLTIIEVDGNKVQPTDVDSIPIHAGQRCSVVVIANQTVSNYWVRPLSNLQPTFTGGQNMAILRYDLPLMLDLEGRYSAPYQKQPSVITMTHLR